MRGSDRDELKTENERLRAELSEQSDNNIALEGQFSRIRGEFNTIFDTVSALIWYQGKDGRLLRVNKAAAMSVNMTPQEMVGKDYYELFGNDSDQARSKDNEVISSGKPIIGDLSRFESIDGQVRYAMVDRYPYRDEKGEIVGLVGFAQDVTERKAADDALRDAQAELERTNEQLSKSLAKSDYLAKQAVSANKAKSRFVAAVSHDSRTAINAVLGFSELLLEEDLGKDQLGYVKVIKSAAGSILELTNDILDLASMEANKLEIKTARESLGSIVSKVVELLTHSASNKGIEFDVLAEGEVPTHIVTDSMRFRQCLVNLVSNAIKFTECGHVHIIVSTRIDNEKPFICVSVEDTGIGIPADMQEAIFE
ncbi:MAG: PAS domain-containing protein, partial [Anaerohalosphaera sp.]|nr:PAS domain-containing protein [Anaerohalosphaera sp.]